MVVKHFQDGGRPPFWKSMYLSEQEAQLSLTNCAMLFCKVFEVLQDVLLENVDK